VKLGFASWPLSDCDVFLLNTANQIDPSWRTNPEVVSKKPFWLEKLKTGVEEEKRDALAFLGMAGGDDVVQPILDAMNGPDFRYRFDECIRALGHCSSPLAVQPVMDSFDKAGKNAGRVRAALKEMTGQDFGTDKQKWVDWWAQNKGRHGL